ncbi:MAG TPA: ferritin-like domain-containing protein [Candidatus Nanopelagicales bacterium]|nr:ferritin-like domain-containing protein [Candidatus Nanopelagicales bacterium]
MSHIGMNRTGADLSPIDSNEAADYAKEVPPSSSGDEQDAAEVRADYAREAPSLGSVPPPGTLKGMAKSAVQVIQGKSPSTLIDKLGERLAFERTGSRLYEGLIAKLEGKGSFPGGPTREDLLAIHDEELRHFELVRDAILRLGGDPTAMTPAADMMGVASMGLLQVINDPRTTVAQGLEAILIAELADNDGWEMLIDLARSFGQGEIADSFHLARATEERHLEICRRWVAGYMTLDARGEIEEPRKAA